MIEKLLKTIKAPLIILFVIIILEILAYYQIIPSIDEITVIITDSVEKSGLIVVGLISFLENIVGLNVYFPGSVIILIAMTQTAGDPQRAFVTYLVIYAFAFLAYNVNFLIGKYYFKSVDEIKERKLMTHDKKYKNMWVQFLTTFWHPHFAAVTCLYVGSKGYKYKDILKYMIVASFIWNTFWAITLYNVGLVTKTTTLNFKGLVYLYLIGWIALETYKFYKKEKEKKLKTIDLA